MQETSLSGTLVRDCVWTSAIGAFSSVAISPDGKWWATGSGKGDVCIWEEGSQTLCQMWSAHANAVGSLAFSPDGQTLASSSIDGTVKLWDSKHGTLLENQ
jgi:WD40 repeat protein